MSVIRILQMVCIIEIEVYMWTSIRTRPNRILSSLECTDCYARITTQEDNTNYQEDPIQLRKGMNSER